jgi:NAD(P)-dependent dehydrogenase (short-subunit alcohol dehydrogenase family)
VKVDLSGKTAIVTGAGAGVGRAIALALAAAGASVGVNDINPDRVEDIAEAIQAAGGNAAAFQGDVGNRFQASALIERTRDAFNAEITIAVNAAGAFLATPLDKVDEWDWRRQIEVNMTGTFFVTQLISRVMRDAGGGVILNLASAHSTLDAGIPYVATKAGILGLTRQAARELAPDNVRVNAICPGNISDDDLPTDAPSMLGGTGTPADVAHAALFLVSDAARFITGQALCVDGGMSAL